MTQSSPILTDMEIHKYLNVNDVSHITLATSKLLQAQHDASDAYWQDRIKEAVVELEKYKVLLQPREGYVTLMIPDNDWQALSNKEGKECG